MRGYAGEGSAQGRHSRCGLGTRFLPATKAMPKEMLPLIDRPVIQYVVEEAVASGMDDLIIITAGVSAP